MSWSSMMSRQTSSARLQTPVSTRLPMVRDMSSTETTSCRRPPRIRSSGSMRKFGLQRSSRASETSRPAWVEKSYNQIIHASRGNGLFLECKRDTQMDSQTSTLPNLPEALPQSDLWENHVLSAPSSRSSKAVSPGRRPDEGMDRRSGEITATRKRRLSCMGKWVSQIFGRVRY
jgi:hypothetical protein